MLEKSLGLLFFLRKPSPFRKGPWLLMLRITVDGIPKELSLKRTWEPSRWDKDKGRASGNKEDAKAMNTYIELILAKAQACRSKLIEKEVPITSVAIKDELSGSARRKRMFSFLFEDHNKEIAALVPKGEYSEATLLFVLKRIQRPEVSNRPTEPAFTTAIYGMKHPLHFKDLGGKHFEQLVFVFLNEMYVWNNLEWRGENGGDSGQDLWGVRKGMTYCIQCANHRSLPLRKALADLQKSDK